MDIKTFKNVIKNLDGKLKLTQDNLEQRSMELPLLYHEYLDIYSKELRVLKALHADKKKLYGDTYYQIKHKGNITWDTKAEIDSQVLADTSYHQMCVNYSRQEVMVEQLEKCLDNIRNLSFQVKNVIEYRKLFGM